MSTEKTIIEKRIAELTKILQQEMQNEQRLIQVLNETKTKIVSLNGGIVELKNVLKSMVDSEKPKKEVAKEAKEPKSDEEE